MKTSSGSMGDAIRKCSPVSSICRTGARSISEIKLGTAFGSVVSVAAMARLTTNDDQTGFKDTPDDTTRRTRLNGLRARAV